MVKNYLKNHLFQKLSKMAKNIFKKSHFKKNNLKKNFCEVIIVILILKIMILQNEKMNFFQNHFLLHS